MTNVNATVHPIAPLGGADGNGRVLGFLPATSKVAQNDTITVTNAASIEHANLVIIATGADETHTIATNVLTLTSATTATSGFRGLVVFRPK